MTAHVSSLYAACFAILLVAFAINVTVHRARLGVQVGDGSDARMLRMIRIHGNAAEYLPIALALMIVYEINGGHAAYLHAAGAALIVGRLLHAWGLWRTAGPTFGRIAGPSLTWVTILTLAGLNVMNVAGW